MRRTAQAIYVLIVMLMAGRAFAQAAPAVTHGPDISVFSGMTGLLTGLSSAKNLGTTAGVDIGLPYLFDFHPSLEGRATYSFYNGQVDRQKNALGGFKASRRLGRFSPYGDLLFGRGEMYYRKGYPSLSHSFLYLRTTSWVVSPGFGAAYEVSRGLSVKADIQFENYGTPVTESGHIWAVPLTLGFAYRFDFDRRVW